MVKKTKVSLLPLDGAHDVSYLQDLFEKFVILKILLVQTDHSEFNNISRLIYSFVCLHEYAKAARMVDQGCG